ncbi:MAG: class I SAM-dependent methyltransferase [Chthoniobacterales bacterium]
MEAPESLKYSIDYATRDAISGWALDEKGPVNVSVVINGERAPLTVQRIMRDDVANAFPSTPDATQSGFRILLPVERLAQSPVAEVGLSIGKESVRLELPSASMTNDAAVEFWRGKQSPFPPEVMALVESTSAIGWRQQSADSEELIGEAVEVLLFLLRVGSRRAHTLFRYFTFLSRVAHAFRFNERHFPRTASSSDKGQDGVASTPEEHFLIAHHLFTLKAHGLAGDLLEFGCFKGFSTACLSFASHLLGVRMHVFDSFEGLPVSGSSYYTAGDFAGALEEVANNIAAFGHREVVTFHKGFFADVLPTMSLGSVSCIWMDVDLESSARDLMQVLPLLDRGGCVFSHECWPEHFSESQEVIAPPSHESVLPPVKEAFLNDARQPHGRYLGGRLGVVWDGLRSVPPPSSSLLRLYQVMLAG